MSIRRSWRRLILIVKNIVRVIEKQEEGVFFDGGCEAKRKAEQNLANHTKTCKNEKKPALSEVKKDVESSWSEKDEKMLDDAYIMLDWYKGNNWWKAQHIKDWLKSLKERINPEWKPSEEQLDALHDAAMYVDKSMFPHQKGILMKLYKQLKKLIEG